MPKRVKIVIFGRSSSLICLNSFKAKGKRIIEARKNLKKAKRKGEIVVKLHLKIGEAAPQIKLAIIRAIIA